jgi:predicted transcriptional regulator
MFTNSSTRCRKTAWAMCSTTLTNLGVDLEAADETLSAATEAAIEEGLDDIRNGRTISLEEYRR